MRVLELFSGYGSQALALENLGIEFTSDISEIDKYAIQAYNQLHGETHNWGDITKIDETKLPYYDLITYSSPCQDFSVAGLGKGGDMGSGTRSSLLWECERIIRAVKPKYLLMENVKNLVGEKHKHNFIRWLHILEMMGYQNFYKVLNAKDYGVPQNRERVFVVSILGCQQYLFPNPIKLTKRLKDVLESDVDEKYYLSDKICERFQYNKIGEDIVGSTKEEECTRQGNRDVVYSTEHKVGAISATDYKQPKQILEPLLIKENTAKGYTQAVIGDSINLEQPNSETRRGRIGHQVAQTLTTACNQGVVQIGNIVHTGNWDNPERGRIYSDEGVSPALSTMQGGGLEPKILDEQNKYIKKDGIVGTLTTDGSSPKHNNRVIEKNYRIRKLTPRECWRLMGVKDEQFDKLHDLSNTQLYKLAGNSIVVDVLVGIFKNLLLSDEGTKGQLSLL